MNLNVNVSTIRVEIPALDAYVALERDKLAYIKEQDNSQKRADELAAKVEQLTKQLQTGRTSLEQAVLNQGEN